MATKKRKGDQPISVPLDDAIQAVARHPSNPMEVVRHLCIAAGSSDLRVTLGLGDLMSLLEESYANGMCGDE